jgi:hypothetical protein
MNAKLTFIGPMQTRNGKQFREIGGEGWTENKSAWKIAPQFDSYKVGDTVDLLVSDDGRYINAVKPVGSGGATRPFTGGKGWSKGGSGAPDPEKNVSVYTSYVLEYLIAPHQKDKLSVAEAVKLLFEIREAVAKRFSGSQSGAASAETATASVEDGIKIDTALALVQQVDEQADSKVWRPYISAALKRKGGYDLLMKNINACLTGEKLLDMTPDGVPVFVSPESA